MKRLKVNRCVHQYTLKIILMLFVLPLLMAKTKAQNSYDIRLEMINTNQSDMVCFNVQIKSGAENTWYLAGQNYRLFYDGAKASFVEGSSLLGPDYQAFKLIQHREHASVNTENGNLSFEDDMSFLNFAIDLLDANKEGELVPANGDWLNTAQLCFESTGLPDIVWARNGRTDDYAISFVDISAWLGVNETKTAIANQYVDFIAENEVIEIEEEYGEEIEDIHNINGEIVRTYNIRTITKEANINDSNTICYDIQLQSGDATEWYLAGQNYRLYYDASNVKFKSGQQLIGANYQAFQLIEDIHGVDASSISNGLPFGDNLGFLNFTIDLLNTSRAGVLLPIENNWISTVELCFEVLENYQEEDAFCMVWAKEGQTDVYATSFLEIASWNGINQTSNSKGVHYNDPLSNCEGSNDENRVMLNAKVLLQGPYKEHIGMMDDQLRVQGYLPTYNPYHVTNVEEANLSTHPVQEINDEVFEKEGEEAVVDWIHIELRDRYDMNEVVGDRSALLLRNGKIVDLDGQSSVSFNVPIDSYYVALSHRNHLGVMTGRPIALSNGGNTPLVDFTSPTTLTFGEYSQVNLNGKMALWGGDANGDGYVIFQGAGIGIPDGDYLFFDLFSDERNINKHYNYISKGYLASDTNMDGLLIYQGGSNDIDDLVFFNVFRYPLNTKYYTNFYIEAQLPRIGD